MVNICFALLFMNGTVWDELGIGAFLVRSDCWLLSEVVLRGNATHSLYSLFVISIHPVGFSQGNEE